MSSTHAGREGRVVDEEATTGGHDVGGVEPLLAVADGQRDVDGRQPHGGQLTDRVGTRAGDDEVGRGIREVHPVGVGGDDVGRARPAVVGDELLARAGEVQHLHTRGAQRRDPAPRRSC